MRIALLTLESLPNARAVRRFLDQYADKVVLVGLSNPYRRSAGGALGQTWRRLRGSGPGLLPYLFVNFTLLQLVDALSRPDPADTDRVPLRAACKRRGIACETVTDVNGPDFRAALAHSGADLLLTFHFDQILTAATIAAVPRGGINVHPGLLPRQRGPTPTIHALRENPVQFGVTVHRLTARIDAGAVLAQAAIPDEPGLTASGAAQRLHEAALPLLDAVLSDLASGRVPEVGIDPAPYQGFPTRAELRQLAASGRRVVGWSDVWAAVRR